MSVDTHFGIVNLCTWHRRSSADWLPKGGQGGLYGQRKGYTSKWSNYHSKVAVGSRSPSKIPRWLSAQEMGEWLKVGSGQEWVVFEMRVSVLSICLHC